MALAGAVHTVHTSALAEIDRAAHALAGEADVQVRGPRSGFDDALFARIASLPEVAVASPVLDIDAALARGGRLRIVCIDALRAVRLQPAFIPDRARTGAAEVGTLVDNDALWLSPRPRRACASIPATTCAWLAPARRHRAARRRNPARACRPRARSPRWTSPPRSGASRAWARSRASFSGFAPAWSPPPSARCRADAAARRRRLGRPRPLSQRAADITRAYRVNLDALSLVALATGAFLVFSTLALQAARRRQEFAVLRALGVTRRGARGPPRARRRRIGGSWAPRSAPRWRSRAAARCCARFGADLGAGFFSAAHSRVRRPIPAGARRDRRARHRDVDRGGAVGRAGGGPHRRGRGAARSRRGPSGRGAEARSSLRRWRSRACRCSSAAAHRWACRWAATPRSRSWLACAGARRGAALPRSPRPRLAAQARPIASLALAQVRHLPGHLAASVAGIVVSASLCVAMAIMVFSFRVSVEAWLGGVVRADLYVDAGAPGGDGTFRTTGAAASRWLRIPGVARVEALRFDRHRPRPRALPLTLVARPVDARILDGYQAEPRALPAAGRGNPRLDLGGGARPLRVEARRSHRAADRGARRAGARRRRHPRFRAHVGRHDHPAGKLSRDHRRHARQRARDPSRAGRRREAPRPRSAARFPARAGSPSRTPRA